MHAITRFQALRIAARAADVIATDAGDDFVDSAQGNHYINSSADLNVNGRYKPDDSWSPPGEQVVKAQGPGWGIYLDSETDGDKVTVWSGSDNPAGSDGDIVDAGAGDDWVIASWGADYVNGGAGDDWIDGLAGDDVLEGGDGKDTINADGIIKAGYTCERYRHRGRGVRFAHPIPMRLSFRHAATGRAGGSNGSGAWSAISKNEVLQ